MRFDKLLQSLSLLGVGIVVYYLREMYREIQRAEEILKQQADKDAAASDKIDPDIIEEMYYDISFGESSDHDEPDVLIEREVVIEYSEDNFPERINYSDDDKPFAKMEDYTEEEIADIISQSLDIGEYNESDISFDPNTSLEEAHEALGPGGDRIVFAITPGGKVVSSFFSEDNMKLAKEVAEIEGKPLDDVLLETIAERYDMISEDDD